MPNSLNSPEALFMLGEISSDVKGIMARLDFQNGRIGKLEDRTKSLESTRDVQSGVTKVWGLVTGAASSVVVLLLDYLFTRK